ncbi:MAG: hypothetical protein CMA64_00625 [Euryarchaeota archaeon]|jgi:hypothetical protein|nr:hypothetical protein [Euryarchaeota archaeon]
MTTKGLLIFAKNNEQFNYIKQAEVAGLMAKHYLNVPISLITFEEDYKDNTSDVWDKVIFLNDIEIVNGRGVYVEGKRQDITWYNLDRLLAYDLTPYDETILIDSDYLIQNSLLNNVWENVEPMLMNTTSRTPAKHQEHIYEQVITDGYPNIHWFTVCYFRKCEETEQWFTVAKEIKENNDFYTTTYNSPYTFYRNDLTAAIASHIVNGHTDGWMKPLPTRQINSYAPESIIEVNKGSITLNTGEGPVRLKDTNVHLLNKFEIEKYYDRFVELYG